MTPGDSNRPPSDDTTADIVADVRAYLAGLPASDSVTAAIEEGEQIAAIVEPLRLPRRIVAAVHAYPFFKHNILNVNSLKKP